MYSAACLYLAIPMVLFLAGWAKWWIAVPGICIIAFGMFQMIRDIPEHSYPSFKSNPAIWIAALLVIIVWVYLSGVGRLSFQNADHWWRNRIFYLLVKEDWPVVKAVTVEGVTSLRGMVYYIGFWLPAAMVGKVFGISAGYFFQAVWAVCGVFLFYYFLCTFLKRTAVWPIVVFALFSGLDAVGNAVLQQGPIDLFGNSHYELWASTAVQFSSNTTMLFWVFNQAIGAWLILSLILIQKKNRYLVLIISYALMTSTLPFIGLIPFFLYRGLSNHWCGKQPVSEKIKEFFKDTFTIENIVCGGFVGIFSFLYLKENTAGQHFAFGFPEVVRPFLMRYLFFLFIEVFVYIIAIYRYQKRNVLYWVLIPLFFLFPITQVGYGIDFCMRASIPSLAVLSILVIDSLFRASEKKEWVNMVIIVVLLALGSCTAFHEINRSIVNTMNGVGMKKQVTKEEIMGAENFSSDIDEGFFFRNLSCMRDIELKEETQETEPES